MTANRFKFRYWDGQYMMFIGIGTLGYGSHGEIDLDDVVLMQSTSLTDKNGVEIFEGDILRYDWENIVIKPPEWQVIDAFTVHCRPGLDSFRDDYSRDDEPSRQIREGEVIGNIYQNPELMK